MSRPRRHHQRPVLDLVERSHAGAPAAFSVGPMPWSGVQIVQPLVEFSAHQVGHQRALAALGGPDEAQVLAEVREGWTRDLRALLVRQRQFRLYTTLDGGDTWVTTLETRRPQPAQHLSCTCDARLHEAGLCYLDVVAPILAASGHYTVRLRGEPFQGPRLTAVVWIPNELGDAVGQETRCEHAHHSVEAVETCLMKKLLPAAIRPAWRAPVGSVLSIQDAEGVVWWKRTERPPPEYTTREGRTSSGLRWEERDYRQAQPHKRGQVYRRAATLERNDFEVNLVLPRSVEDRIDPWHGRTGLIEGMALGMAWLLDQPLDAIEALHRDYHRSVVPADPEGVTRLAQTERRRFVPGAFTPPARGEVVVFPSRPARVVRSSEEESIADAED